MNGKICHPLTHKKVIEKKEKLKFFKRLVLFTMSLKSSLILQEAVRSQEQFEKYNRLIQE